MTRFQLRDQAEQVLRATEASRRTAELLLCHALGISRMQLVTRPDQAVSPEAEIRFKDLVSRRLNGEPVAYLLGWREFYGRPFAVDATTLIPRPETEHLVDEALTRLPDGSLKFADLGTGSGCLAITLVAERPIWSGVALDISVEALAVAKGNAEALEVADHLTFMCADFTRPGFWNNGKAGLDLIVSNPPYISQTEYDALEPGVRDYEPRLALVPGPTGLEHPRAVIDAACRLLRPGGLLLMEHGCSQGEATRHLCSPGQWQHVVTGTDLAGLDRYLIAVRL